MLYLAVLIGTDGAADVSHPSEMYANSKEQARQLLLSNVPPESVFGIFTEDEYYARFFPNSNFVSQENIPSFNSCSDETNDIINNALHKCSQQAKQDNANTFANTQIFPDDFSQSCNKIRIPESETPLCESDVKYFTDNGIKYKLENGKLFKQDWIQIQNMQEDENGNIVYPNFRIINKNSGKIIKSSVYIIEQLDWSPITEQ